MVSNELEIALLIVALYGSTCIALTYADEGLLEYGCRGLHLRVADERLRVAGRSFIWLNPLTPMSPAFRGQWGRIEMIMAAPGLPARIPEVVTASAALTPYVFMVFLCAIVGIPVTLLLAGAERALPIAGLAYISAIALVVRLWFLRDLFSLDGKKFALLAFECIACLPFAASVVRRLSLATPVTEDLSSYIIDMPTDCRQLAITALDERCEEIGRFLAENSSAHDRLTLYRSNLAGFACGGSDTSDSSALKNRDRF